MQRLETDPEEWLDSVQVRALLRVKRQTLYNWRCLGTAPPAYRVGRALLWRRRDVEEWLAARRDQDPVRVAS